MTGRLTAWHVIRRAAMVARGELPVRVIVGALIVFAPFVALQIGASFLAEHIRDTEDRITGLVAIVLLPQRQPPSGVAFSTRACSTARWALTITATTATRLES